ncbi:MAG: hypothetical protein ACRENE_16380 [Polyangiaceae bacterium]
MRASSIKLWVGCAAAVASLVLGAAGSATAQGTAGGAGGSATAGGQVNFQRTPQLTPQEQSSKAVEILAKMDQASASVQRLLEHARAVRDVVKTLGLSDKLSQINVAVRSARDRQAALQAALSRNDTELANHEFTLLTVLLGRVEQLVAEANEVLGEEMAFVGNTQVTSQAPDDLPAPEDTNGFPGGPVPPVNPVTVPGFIPPPPGQSPFK